MVWIDLVLDGRGRSGAKGGGKREQGHEFQREVCFHGR
jgi:hypothetical protein